MFYKPTTYYLNSEKPKIKTPIDETEYLGELLNTKYTPLKPPITTMLRFEP